MAKTNSTINSLKWSTLGHILPQVIKPVITIYIARLLSPEDLGLFAISTIIISFTQIFLSQGFTSALIQKKGSAEEINATADFIFSFNFFLSLLFYSVIVLSSSFIADFFHNPASRSVIAIFSLSLIIHALGDIQLGMLLRVMDFKSIFFRQLIPVFSLILITLPLAYLGYGVWALVIGWLLSDCFASIILWFKSEWRPKFNFKYKDNIDTIKFSTFVIFTSLMGWILMQGDNLVVGKFLSTSDLGLYKTGFDLIQRFFGIFIIPILPVFYSIFCSLNQKDDIIKTYLKVKSYLSIIVFPVMFGILLISPYFEHLILSNKWKGISMVLAFLTITGISNLWALMDGLFKSLGKPNIPAKISLIVVMFDIPIWLFFIQFGLKVFLISRILNEIVGVTVNTYFENKELGINLKQALLFYYKPLFASIIMTLGGFYFQMLFFNQIFTLYSLVILILVSTIIYGLIIWSISKVQVEEIIELILRKKLAN